MNYHFKTNGVESSAQLPVITVVLKTAVQQYLQKHDIDCATYADNLDVDRYKLNAFLNSLMSMDEFTLKEIDRMMTFHKFDVDVNVTER